MRASEQDRPDAAEHRRLGRAWQRFMDPERFVFVDETGAATNMIRRHGGAPRSERLVAAAPHGHWRTTTFVAGLLRGWPAQRRLGGPARAGRPDDRTGVPGLRRAVPGTHAPARRRGRHGPAQIADLAARKVAGIEGAIRAVGASLPCLPPYSPDLNPIEQVFAKFKALLRSAAARTKEAPWATIGRLLGRFSPAEGRNYLANSGYEFT